MPFAMYIIDFMYISYFRYLKYLSLVFEYVLLFITTVIFMIVYWNFFLSWSIEYYLGKVNTNSLNTYIYGVDVDGIYFCKLVDLETFFHELWLEFLAVLTPVFHAFIEIINTKPITRYHSFTIQCFV